MILQFLGASCHQYYFFLKLPAECGVYDPAEGYKVIFTCSNYEEIQLWLLEDEYEPIEGHVSVSEFE